MKRTFYTVTHSYNAGLLEACKAFKTYEEAKAFAVDYMANFKDCCKSYAIHCHEMRKLLGITLSHKATLIEENEEA